MPAKFALSLAAVDVLSEWLEVDVRQFPLNIPFFGDYIEDRTRIADAVWADMEHRGLAPGGKLHPDVSDALTVLARYEIGVAILGTSGDEEIRARAGVAGNHGAIARLGENLVDFELIRPESLVGTMVGLLPDARPGPGRSTTITTEVSTVDDESDGIMVSANASRNTAGGKLRASGIAIDQPHTGAGFFLITTRDGMGRQATAPSLSWFDIDAGRYVAVEHPARPDTPASSTIAPSDNSRIAGHLQRMLNSL
ncbi:ESAT-6 protein secretion system EspG family protein [Herbihabitans rhizosphaerae]|uniref:ESAT-6 protein secretion system EspG family protein n=1 Tax=Herbihabitans rhizosphaerae TaxID=1872711 RepID=A0A4Q7KZX4_9PSEU|nr:ESX secretion-associated protein EspG [Herbihabitans rhizosphaerae]RZS41292.1 ESAT-6 protein secretion system EspG family protein [Herbihabitans rhizosphaerae]